jgi:rhodanese-related sulfurtransferase
MNRFISLLLIMLLGLVSACGPNTFKNVSVKDLADASEANKVVLDVREGWEYAEGHVAGAILIPLGELERRSNELSKDDTLYVICRSGNRSQQASDILAKKGFKNVRNVQGGTLAWIQAGYQIEQ